jgi:diketogulonate reductase-like aldo/keto reductase
LDTYLLHWRGNVPLAETFRALEDLERAGKIGAFGVSNFDTDDLEEALALVGPGRIACNQVLYHLDERSAEFSVAPWCREHDVAVVAYSPFGSGAFPSARSVPGNTLAQLAARRDATPYQLALAFLVDRCGAFAIPKAASSAHALENAAAGEIVLDATERDAIDAAFPAKPRRTLAMI